MNCTNCGKPHNGKFISIMGMFKVCETCTDAEKKLKAALKAGIVVETKSPKTGETKKQIYKVD